MTMQQGVRRQSRYLDELGLDTITEESRSSNYIRSVVKTGDKYFLICRCAQTLDELSRFQVSS